MSFATVLRDYQKSIADEALGHLLSGHSTMIVMPTGTGKTATAADVVRRWPGRVLWIAHRIELVMQAGAALSRACGEIIGHETSEPELKSDAERIVVGSKDTVRTETRLTRLAQAGFSLLVCDEHHHSAAYSYQKIIQALGVTVLGLTATPRRVDQKDLGVQKTTTPLGIVECIEQGWLVPILLKKARVKSVDLSGVSTVAGDFAPGELDAIMRAEESLHGVCSATISSTDQRPTIIYASSVAHAQRLSEILRRNGKTAEVVTGETKYALRKGIFQGFGRDYQYLCNVGVATEGTDLPEASCIAVARPTKSPVLMTQILGRGLRPLKGVDDYDTAESRKNFISGSRKANCLVLDFVGATGKHRLSTAIDLLADSISGKVRNAATGRVYARLESDGTIDVYQALKDAEAQELEAVQRREEQRKKKEEARKKILGRVSFDMVPGQFGDGNIHNNLHSDAATLSQINRILSFGLPIPRNLSRQDAQKIILSVEQARDMPSGKQQGLLKSLGKWTDDMTRTQAKKIIGRWYASGGRSWQRMRH